MPILRTHDVFSTEALSYTEEFGAKAGLLRLIKDRCPNLVHNILDGEYIPWGEISSSKVKSIITSMGDVPALARATHFDDGVGYIGRLETNEINEWNMEEERKFSSAERLFYRELDILGNYSERLGYRGVAGNTGVYIQEKLQDKGTIFGNLVEHPNILGVYIISGGEKYGFHGQAYIDENANPEDTEYRLKQREHTVQIPQKDQILNTYKQIRETGLLKENIAGQMEFAVTPDGKVYILQLRAFRKREYANWKIGDSSSNKELVFGVTPESGVEVNMSDLHILEILMGSGIYNKEIISGLFRQDYKRSLSADIPLEDMDLVVANSSSAAFEHDVFELASLSDRSVLLMNTKGIDLEILGRDNITTLQYYCDGENYKIERI